MGILGEVPHQTSSREHLVIDPSIVTVDGQETENCLQNTNHVISPTMALWTLNSVSLSGRDRPRLEGLNAIVPFGRVAILGASGSGKTSFLNLLVGFERPDAGQITFHADDCRQSFDQIPLFWSPADYGLWPHLTVREHLQAVSSSADREVIDSLLDDFGLLSVCDSLPGRLSQGERSRVSVARAIAAQPLALVFDEPLEHVDMTMREHCWRRLRERVEATRCSFVFSTHSPERVLSEAEWCLCLERGRLVWSGPVQELYSHPATPALAEFLGPCNWLAAPISRLSASTSVCHTEPSPVPVRPERLQIISTPDGPYCVESERFMGTLSEVELIDVATATRHRYYHRPPGQQLSPGSRVSLRVVALFTAMVLCLWQSGCQQGNAAELPVISSQQIRIPVDGKRMPAPRALTIGPTQELYVLDDSGRILVYDKENQLVRQWNMPESDVGKPEGIRVLQDGRVAIADTHYHRVVFFTQQGELLGMFGTQGDGPGEFTYPVDLLQDPKGFLYVAEYGGSDRIQKFTSDGRFVLQFGGLGTGVGEFQRPSGMVWIDSKIYVADAINCRVQVFDDQGTPLQVLDWTDQGGLYYPYDIALSPQGQLFFVEYGGCRVSVADPQGAIVARYGREGRNQHELWTPWALAVSEDHRVFIADTGNRRIIQLKLPEGQL